MKAILLAGGQGTRLRPLTLHAPKPVVPIFNRPFLQYQIDLLRQLPEITEIILSLNYQPRRIEDTFGDGTDQGIHLRYVVEPSPLGTAGAVKYAEEYLDEAVIVFNGDVLTEVNLRAVLDLHRSRSARATIVLTPVPNPAAYGLVETDAEGNVQRFLEKPTGDQITCNTINAGIYVLEPDTFDRIPRDTNWSIERRFFPSLVEQGDTFVAYVYDGYWIDIGTPEKYQQVHRDIMAARFSAAPFNGQSRSLVAESARIDGSAVVETPCFVDEDAVVKSGARIGAFSVIGQRCHVGEGAVVEGSILWPDCWIGEGAVLRGAILARHCHVGPGTVVGAGTVLGSRSAVTDFSRVPGHSAPDATS